MSDVLPPFDPYSPPLAEEKPATIGPPPTGLKAICIIAIILGSLGVLLSCFGGVGLVAGQAMQAAMKAPPQAGGDPRMEQMQQEMQSKILDITNEYLVFNVAAVVFHLIAALMLLIGGIMALKVVPVGRSVLLAGFAVAIFYEVGQAILKVIVQMRTIPVMRDFMEQIMQQAGGPQNAGQLPGGFGQLMVVFVYIGIAISLAIVLAKIAFYVFSIYYLKRPEIVARYSVQDDGVWGEAVRG